MKLESENLFESIPKNIKNEIFTELVRSDNIRVERIVSRGHSSPVDGWYDQDDHEWVILLQGEATIVMQGDHKVQLRPGSHINIPAHTKHRVSWTKPATETIWLAVHYR